MWHWKNGWRSYFELDRVISVVRIVGRHRTYIGENSCGIIYPECIFTSEQRQHVKYPIFASDTYSRGDLTLNGMQGAGVYRLMWESRVPPSLVVPFLDLWGITAMALEPYTFLRPASVILALIF